MKAYARLAGAALRQLRFERGLTLRQAAPFFSVSVAALSRKERGIDQVTRDDIRHAIQGYHLTPAEIAELWTAAGMLPDLPARKPVQVDMRSFAAPLLLNLLFPAFVIDTFGHIKAWNQSVEYMWEFSQDQQLPLHLLSRVFSQRARVILGEHWHTEAAKFVNDFYRSTLRVSGRPEYSRMIRMLEERHRDEFVFMWNEARRQTVDGTANAELTDIGGMRVRYESEVGPIEYLVMQSFFRFSAPYSLFIHVPFGHDNHLRYETLSASIGPQRAYFAE
jgi:transcriptional regulator with XRE-family HTH domain